MIKSTIKSIKYKIWTYKFNRNFKRRSKRIRHTWRVANFTGTKYKLILDHWFPVDQVCEELDKHFNDYLESMSN